MISLTDVFIQGAPQGWRTVPFWSLFRREKTTGFPEEELLSVYRDYGVIPKSSRDDNFNKESEDLSGYQLVAKGALVTNKMKAWQGSIAISRYRGIVSPAYYVYTPQSDECDQFLHYLLRSDPYIGLYGRISKGVRVNQWDLEHDSLRNIPVLLPDLETQRQIADFLDRETARIDLLIEKKQRLVALLGERYERHRDQVLFAPNEDLPQQSMRWLIRVGSGDFISNEKMSPEQSSDRTIPVIGGNGVMAYTNRSNTPTDTLVVGRVGALCGNVHFVEHHSWVTDNALIVRLTSKEIHPRYAFEILKSAKLNEKANKSAQPLITGETVKKVTVYVPPKDEQELRVRKLAELSTKLAGTTKTVLSSIDRLKEYRSALITAAVTGQVDVSAATRSGATGRRLDAIHEEMGA